MEEGLIKRIKENDPTLKTIHRMRELFTAKQLADALVSNTTLTDLCLSDLCFTGKQMRVIAESLSHNKSITRLDVSFNSLGDTGAGFVANLLQVNSTLTELDVSMNQIDRIGREAIACALKTNQTLSELYLGTSDYNNTIEEALHNDNGSLTYVWPELISPIIRAATARNRAAHAKTRKAVISVLLIGRFRRPAGIPYDIWKIIGRILWASRVERVWW